MAHDTCQLECRCCKSTGVYAGAVHEYEHEGINGQEFHVAYVVQVLTVDLAEEVQAGNMKTMSRKQHRVVESEAHAVGQDDEIVKFVLGGRSGRMRRTVGCFAKCLAILPAICSSLFPITTTNSCVGFQERERERACVHERIPGSIDSNERHNDQLFRCTRSYPKYKVTT